MVAGAAMRSLRYALVTDHSPAALVLRETSPAVTPPPKLLDRVRARHSRTPLQPPDREGVRPLDPALHLLPRQAPSGRDGRRRDHRVPDGARGPGARRRLDPEPGAQRAAVPVRECSAASCRGSTTWSAPSARSASPPCSRATRSRSVLERWRARPAGRSSCSTGRACGSWSACGCA